MQNIHKGVAGLALSCVCALSFAAEPRQFQINAGSAIKTLNEFSRQAGIQLLCNSDAVRSLSTRAVSGRLETAQALAKMLEGTDLVFEFVNDRTIAVMRRGTPKPDVSRNTSTSGYILIPQRLAAQTDMLIEVAQIANDAQPESETKKASSKSDVEEMVVEGAREKKPPFSTANLDLTRTRDDALPFTTFTSRDIALSGATSLDEFLTNRLPQNFSEVVLGEVSAIGTSQINRVSMRGWGVTETVFLLNGRRMAPQFYGADGDASNATPNLQGIPLRSIERIEILSSAGSAIYGANATGGVINIITRTDYQGGQFTVNYATPADVHAPNRGAQATYAVPAGWGTSLRLTASYNESEPMQVGDRSAITVERWRSMVLAREPARLLSRTATSPLGATPNIRTVATDVNANLFGPGTANFTTVPDGYTGGGGISVFQPGVYNLQLSEDGGSRNIFSKSGYLGAETSNTVFALGADKNFAQNWRWSMDYRYSQNNVVAGGGSATAFITVPAAAAVNPFGRDVRVRLTDPQLSRPYLRGYQKNVTWDVTSTLHGRVGKWTGYWDLGYSHNNNSGHSDSFSSPRGGWTNAVLNGNYNPFVDIRVASPAISPAFYDDYQMTRLEDYSAGEQYLSTLKTSGPLLQLPAGDLQLTAGVEWVRMNRGKSLYFAQTVDSLTGMLSAGALYQFYSSPANRFVFDTHSAYVEVNAPVMGDLPLVKRLELTASGRLDRRYSEGVLSTAANNFVNNLADQDLGIPFQAATQSHVYALGMRYDMAEGMTLRASQSIGFKPPSLYDIGPVIRPAVTETQTVSDPRRRNGTAPSTVVLDYQQFISGGNSELRPETSTSTNFGFIFTPARIPGLRVSVDYLETVRDDVISYLYAQLAVDLEAELPGRVIRGAPDGHPSGVGPITFLDLRQINFRQMSSRSVDFTLDQKFQNVLGGRLGLTVAATRNLSFKVQASATAPPVEQVRNIEAAFSQQIAWNGNGQLYWEGKQWGFGWSARYYDYLLVAQSNRLLQGSSRAPSEINHDAFVSYRTPKTEGRSWQRFLSGTAITFGMRNVLDREPRFWAASTDRGVAPYDSIMGRSLWLQMNKDFD